MSAPIARSQLQNLALLYLYMAYGADDYLSDAELGSFVEQLQTHVAGGAGPDAHDVMMAALDAYAAAADTTVLARRAAADLGAALAPPSRKQILHDLSRIARADGIMLERERGQLAWLAEAWGVPLTIEQLEQPLARTSAETPEEDFGVWKDLAYIYLVLAHGTDDELSGVEVQVMTRKLQEWQPQYNEEHARAVLEAAMERYAEGTTDERIAEAVESVRSSMPPEQRMAALHDLIQIANADGIFLDNEEDLLNHLVAAWEVDPYAGYGPHGRKNSV